MVSGIFSIKLSPWWSETVQKLVRIICTITGLHWRRVKSAPLATRRGPGSGNQGRNLNKPWLSAPARGRWIHWREWANLTICCSLMLLSRLQTICNGSEVAVSCHTFYTFSTELQLTTHPKPLEGRLLQGAAQGGVQGVRGPARAGAHGEAGFRRILPSLFWDWTSLPLSHRPTVHWPPLPSCSHQLMYSPWPSVHPRTARRGQDTEPVPSLYSACTQQPLYWGYGTEQFY